MDDDSAKIKVGNDEVDPSKTVSELGLRHGSLVSVVPPPRPKPTAEEKAAAALAAAKDAATKSDRWDPFPSLAKSSGYSSQARRTKAVSRARSGGMSYSAISDLRSSMHEVEPQNEGSVKRIYMCTTSADRFRDGCHVVPTKKQMKAAAKAGRPKPQIETRNRCALLFGTAATERVDQKREKVRTSLSTPLYEREMCQVVKVQAVWEPPQTSKAASGKDGGGRGPYDAGKLTQWDGEHQIKKALSLADKLGLTPVGWIYSYSEDRHDPSSGSGSGSGSGSAGEGGGDEDALPVYIPDAVTGALLQINNMKSSLGRDEGKKFVTLAMDSRSGSCEAFQLSDVCVQMVSEGVLTAALPSDGKREDSDKKGKKDEKGSKGKKAISPPGRFARTTEPIIIHNEETTEIDSVLCLVNTALLAHSGSFAGSQVELGIKRGSGALTAKSTKRILAALDGSSGGAGDGGTGTGGGNDSALLEALCDFNVLMGLSALLRPREMDELCVLVRKWSRGQKRGTVVGRELKLALRSVLGG